MLKLTIKGVVFIFICLVVLSFTDRLFVNKGLYQLKREDYSENKGKVNVAFFGSSHSLCSYDPRIFELELGVNTYNFGVASQRLVTSMPVFHKVIRENDLQLGIVDIFSATLQQPPYNERVAGSQMKTLNHIGLSWSKIKAHNEIFGKENVLNISPTIKNHAGWKDRLFKADFVLTDNVDFYKGFYSSFSFRQPRWEKSIRGKKINKTKRIKKNKKLSEFQKRKIDEVIQLFNDENIDLLFVSSPYHRDYIGDEYFTYQKLIKEYLNIKGVPFIDFNEYWDELKLHKYDFRDLGHLNSRGALKTSKLLADYIKENYDVHNDKLSSEENLNNRYYLINNNLDKAIATIDVKNKKLIKETGVEKIVIYEVMEGRLEMMALGEKNSIKSVKIKVEFDVKNNLKRLFDRYTQKYIKKGRFSYSTRLERGTSYNNKAFKVFKLNYPLKEIKNLEIYLGKKSPNIKIFNTEKLSINAN
ncbi:hypothetical protein [Flagellimonas sp.]|jgi:hypothetical protein|uniref:hypothetical protein n=1 Tax=Flagellimonas sp. TaxID=2058762 RepID=UPI003BAB5380